MNQFYFVLQPSYCLQAYTGHASHILSLDFHPKKNDLFCFCDSNNEIRFWNTSPFSCAQISKVNLLRQFLKCFCFYFLVQFLILHDWDWASFVCYSLQQGGSAQVRFQPITGHLLAAASDKVVTIYDVENDRQTHSFQVCLDIFDCRESVLWLISCCTSLFVLGIWMFWSGLSHSHVDILWLVLRDILVW